MIRILFDMFSLFNVSPFVVAALSGNRTPQDYGNALRDAIHEGNFRFARILVCKCKDSALGRDQIGNMPVTASSKGDGGVVKMLLDAVADGNTQGGHFGNALRAATNQGHEKVVQILMDAGAHAATDHNCPLSNRTC